MSMLDSFFYRGFRADKCKTLLKLTIPRIKLLRNRRDLQIKQMRRDIAKLLQTGQEATARIRVEHIIREENMMAAQEIIELYCELLAVRLPIMEAQRECPLDLKEAVSSICFAAPRCADLPELMQVQMLFGTKYGKEFVAAASELMPDCGVNRQVVELLSIRAPSSERKLALLKQIAEDHQIDWDSSAMESELSKLHEDLLNGPIQATGGSKLPLPQEKHDQTVSSFGAQEHNVEAESDSDTELEFPEVPKSTVLAAARSSSFENPVWLEPDAHQVEPKPASSQKDESRSDMNPTNAGLENYESLRSGQQFVPTMSYFPGEILSDFSETKSGLDSEVPVVSKTDSLSVHHPSESVPVIPPETLEHLQPKIHREREEMKLDLHEVIAAAKAAAENAENAAATARSAASLAQTRMSELTEKNRNKFQETNENPFFASIASPDEAPDAYAFNKLQIDQQPRKYSLEEDADSSYPNLFSNSSRGF